MIGGPGCGKSSIRAGVFYDLKFRGIDCEEAPEVAKDLIWSKNLFTLKNQIKIFGEQHDRIYRLLGQVEAIITDSPLLLTSIYDNRKTETLRNLALEEFNGMWNYVVFLKRCKPYNQNGRNQNEEEAKKIDRLVVDFLLDNQIPFETTKGTLEGRDYVVKKVLMLLGKSV